MVALVLGGLLIAAIGARWTLLLAGTLPAIAGVIGFAAYRRMRSGQDLEPVPEAA